MLTLVTGGPQTRYGGHRNYIKLARYLCSRGVAVFRFDCVGMGDSEGDFVSYKDIGPSIVAAIEFLNKRFEKLIIYSLCDGCVPSLSIAVEDQTRIAGLIMVNPYILEEENVEAKARLKQYYFRRVLSFDFWHRVIRLKIDIQSELRNLSKLIRTAISLQVQEAIFRQNRREPSLSHLLFEYISKFKKPIFFIISTGDIVALEFLGYLNSIKMRIKLRKNRIQKIIVKRADHTFTHSKMQEKLFTITHQAVKEINMM